MNYKEKRHAYIFDVDGTLANVDPFLHYIRNVDDVDGFKKDFDLFHRESINAMPNIEVREMLYNALFDQFDVIIVTSRREMWRPQTSFWLSKFDVPHNALFMRKNDDYRSDFDVKKDILDEIKQFWNIYHAVDDNPSVISLWELNGIPTTKIGDWDGNKD